MSLTTQRLQFGAFILDLDERVLMCGDSRIPITPKAFVLLQNLVENQGHTLEKEQLMASVWPDSFVEDGNLSFTINMLRKALGDDSHNPRFIQTVPRRGYRFIEPVTEAVAPKEETPIVGESMAAAGKVSSRSQNFSRPATLILILGLLVASSWYVGGIGWPVRSEPILSAESKAERISSSGDVRHAVISPDGKHVAYTSETEGRENIWLRNIDTSENVQVIPPGDVHYLGLAFSYDGESLYFVSKHRDDNSPSAVYRIGFFGGIPVKIVDNAEGWVSASPDDRQISFVRCNYRDEDHCSLYTANVENGSERKILSRQRPIRIGANQFSPDGRSIAFAAGHSWNGGSDFGIIQVDLESEVEAAITDRKFFNIKSLNWLPSGDGLLFTAMGGLNGNVAIWHAAVSTGKSIALTTDALSYGKISVDRIAERMIATQVSNDFRLYRSANGGTRDLVAARGVAFTPGGGMVFWGNDNNIWTVNSDGVEQRQLTNDPFSEMYPCVSHDGRYVFFVSNRTGTNQVWRMNSDGTNQIQVTTHEGGYPRFVTPDGKWVYYSSSLRHTLWIVSSESGDERQVSDQKMFEPAFSPDGSLVAYFFHNKKWLIGVLDIADKKLIKVLDFSNGRSTATKLAWSADNRTINYVTNIDSRNALWAQSLDEETPRLIADLGGDEVADFALAPNNNGFAYTRGKWLHDAILFRGLK